MISFRLQDTKYMIQLFLDATHVIPVRTVKLQTQVKRMRLFSAAPQQAWLFQGPGNPPVALGHVQSRLIIPD